MRARLVAILVLASPAAAEPILPILSALCPKPKDGEIIVCASKDPPKSPYRLPLPSPPDRGSRNSASVSRERNALFDYDSGGMLSCSTSGASGSAGCGFKAHKNWVEQRAGAKSGGGYLYDEPPR